jgi:hypothetical protein
MGDTILFGAGEGRLVVYGVVIAIWLTVLAVRGIVSMVRGMNRPATEESV